MKKLFFALMAIAAIFVNFVIAGCDKNVEDEPLSPENSDVFVVTGVVVSEDGAPLPGAVITVKGTTRGTGTVADGSYRLTGVHYGDVLECRYTGMKTQYITVTSTIINITMEVDALQSEEAVVTT